MHAFRDISLDNFFGQFEKKLTSGFYTVTLSIFFIFLSIMSFDFQSFKLGDTCV